MHLFNHISLVHFIPVQQAKSRHMGVINTSVSHGNKQVKPPRLSYAFYVLQLMVLCCCYSHETGMADILIKNRDHLSTYIFIVSTKHDRSATECFPSMVCCFPVLRK